MQRPPLLPPASPYEALSPASTELSIVTAEEIRCGMSNFTRRNLFKVMLALEGTYELHYATRTYVVDRPALLFTNRLVPYSWVAANGPRERLYICAFTEAFLRVAMQGVNLQESVLYRADGNPVYFLNPDQVRYYTDALDRMHRDVRSDYAHRFELLRNQLAIILHEATRLHPAAATHPPANAAERITTVFLMLLDAQYTAVSSPPEPVLRKPAEYADRLAIHVNYLNAALKETTGQSTTEHLNQRLVAEARQLLGSTDLGVAEIAYRLGFEYASYFTSFFKKNAGCTPLEFRRLVSGQVEAIRN